MSAQPPFGMKHSLPSRHQQSFSKTAMCSCWNCAFLISSSNDQVLRSHELRDCCSYPQIRAGVLHSLLNNVWLLLIHYLVSYRGACPWASSVQSYHWWSQFCGLPQVPFARFCFDFAPRGAPSAIRHTSTALSVYPVAFPNHAGFAGSDF